ncbi:PilZ domain-containing protein [Singulisphaera sp. PoT]|uniref:PilZ domain-containing protein n=1 Tax=Singulisphaera sp. PoT TaxID=3411797 RepID=UPI003BF5D047
MLQARSSSTSESDRQHQRLPARGKVLVRPLDDNSPQQTGVLLDLSGGGARFSLRRPLDEGTVVSLTLMERGSKDRRNAGMLGQVVFTKPEGDGHVVGVVFGWEADPGSGNRKAAGLWPWIARHVPKRYGAPRTKPTPPSKAPLGRNKRAGMAGVPTPHRGMFGRLLGLFQGS